MHIDLCFKSCIVVPDDVPYRPKHVAFIDDIIKNLLCLKVIYIYIYIYIYMTRRFKYEEVCSSHLCARAPTREMVDAKRLRST
jgi:hypothetical protein